MDEVGDKLDASLKSEVQADMDALQKVVDETANMENITDSQVDALKNGREKLMNSAQKLFAKIYEQTQQGQGGQGGFNPQDFAGSQGTQQSGGNGGKNDDDVIDADFKEV